MIAGGVGFGYELSTVNTKQFLREPLVHFLLIGAALFGLNAWLGGGDKPSAGASGGPAPVIMVTRADIEPLVVNFRRQNDREPTAAELRALADQFVHDEVIYREALALGLDKGDTVVRRRLQQKMEFILDDVSIEVPTDDQLKDYMARNMDTYGTDPQVAFRHVFVNVADRGAAGEAHARALLERLRQGTDAAGLGDQSPLQTEYPLSALSKITADYGDAFGRALMSAPTNSWAGPFTSKLGLHLVYVETIEKPQLKSLDQMRGMAKRGWELERREQLKEAAYEKMRQRYEVKVELNPKEDGKR
jgi:hypothetical protein